MPKVTMILTLSELSIALQNMKNNKSPGTDGFSSEFFKSFLEKIRHLCNESSKS